VTKEFKTGFTLPDYNSGLTHTKHGRAQKHSIKITMQKKTTFIFPLSDRGTYSELNVLVLGQLYAKAINAEFFVDDRQWAASPRSGLREYFETDVNRWLRASPHLTTFRHSLRAKLATTAFNLLPSSKILSAAHAFDQFMSAKFWKESLGFADDSTVNQWLYNEKKHAFKELYRFNTKTFSRISAINGRLAPQEPYCAVHVRRGDKITSKEMRAISLESYAEAIAKQPHKTALIFSDDFRIFAELRTLSESKSPSVQLINCTDESMTGFSEKDYRNMRDDERIGAVTRVFAEMELMRRAQYLVCTFSSNVSRFAALYVGLENCLSLDCNWHPY